MKLEKYVLSAFSLTFIFFMISFFVESSRDVMVERNINERLDRIENRLDRVQGNRWTRHDNEMFRKVLDGKFKDTIRRLDRIEKDLEVMNK